MDCLALVPLETDAQGKDEGLPVHEKLLHG